MCREGFSSSLPDPLPLRHEATSSEDKVLFQSSSSPRPGEEVGATNNKYLHNMLVDGKYNRKT